MKKLLSVCLAGAFGMAALFAAAACASEEEPEKPDVEAPAFAQADGTLAVSAATDAETPRVSEDLFGLFLEDINYASYALTANMVADCSFDDQSAGLSWHPQDYWSTQNATLTIASQAAERLYSANQYYAVVNAQANGTLSNSGYEAAPIAVEEGVDYIVSFYIKNAGAAFNLTATVKSTGSAGTEYGSVVIPVKQDAGWVKYEYTLTATGTASAGLALELKFGAAVQATLDSVRFETTDSTVGIKNYIYTALQDLSPKFMRFPGGCIIEGSSMNTAYDWKNSIGAVSSSGDDVVESIHVKLVKDGAESESDVRGDFIARTPNVNLWAYNSADARTHYYNMEYAIGFYEYFVLCEQLHAKPVPIVNAGLSCQIQTGDGSRTNVALEGRHGNGVIDYIQDAKDLVYFALGSVNSADADERYWAQVRTDMGHAAPFDLEYLGVGNEEWSQEYYTNYQQFLEAFRAQDANPLLKQVQLIVGNGPNFDQCESYLDDPASPRPGEAKSRMLAYLNNEKISSLGEYGIVDHHYYMGYMDFFSYTDFYDNYVRGGKMGYKVFVGEYSANDQSNWVGNGMKFTHINNSWITALSEAAYMTGLERNGDIVQLAAYAPMFAIASGGGMAYNPPGNNWGANMMFYSNTQLALTPNYYVQQLFMKNQGSLVLSPTLTFAAGKPQTTYTSLNYAGSAAQPRPGTPVDVTIDDIYQVTSIDEATGDIIVKIVNAGDSEFKLNVQIDDATLTGLANVTELFSEELTDVSTLGNNVGYPEYFTIGAFTGSTFGYKLQPYSVTAFRVHVK